mgnify:CR=1 FL=1
MSYFKQLVFGVFQGCSSCCNSDEYTNLEGDSTDRSLEWNRGNDQAQDSVNYEDTRNIVTVSKASEPLDILWKNLGKYDHQFPFIRFLIFIVGLVIILFVSSPALLFSRIQEGDSSGFLRFEWTK